MPDPKRSSLAALLVALAAGLAVAGDEPDVKVKPKAEATPESASELLRPPGQDRYAPRVDWASIPPWRQTSFFGVRAQGRVFVFVVDCSGSMLDEDRLLRAKRELRRSINGLQFPQRFQVIFYNDAPIAMPGGAPQAADPSGKGRLFEWLRLIEADGGTDPRGAMAQALAIRPDAVFLLSDGQFPEGSAESIAKMNRRKVPIHCIDLAGGAEGDDLRRIARDSGGQYTAQP
jgi:hypothetical protein